MTPDYLRPWFVYLDNVGAYRLSTCNTENKLVLPEPQPDYFAYLDNVGAYRLSNTENKLVLPELQPDYLS